MQATRMTALAAIMAFLFGLVVATFSQVRVFFPALLAGAAVTLEIFALSLPLFLILATTAALGRSSAHALLRWLAIFYIEIFRGTSLLVQLFWFFYVLPKFNIVLTPVAAASICIGLNFGAYGAEVVRGALGSVGSGQWEACTALGIPRYKQLLRIIFPQAVVIMIPSMTNLTIELMKATSMVAAVTLVDITSAAVKQNMVFFRTVEIFGCTLILYYCLCQIIRLLSEMLEKRLSYYRMARA